MATKEKKKFRLFDAVLAAVCIVLVVEAAAPAAAIGPMQYFWWAVLLIAFFLPYGLINAELGTTYEGEGGLYDWVKLAFGRKNGSRVAWYYWINFPIWICSLAVLFTGTFTLATGITIPLWLSVIIQLAFTWICVFVSNFRVSESKLLMNAGAVVKVLLMVAVGGLGIWALVSGQGAAAAQGSKAIDSLSPIAGISFISIILFNFMGFEVVATFADDMENPKREIPKAIIVGGIMIAVFYLFSAFGIGAAIPASQLSTDSGLIDAFMIMLKSGAGSPLIVITGILFMFTLMANLISWGPGVNFVAMYAAQDSALPRIFGSENKHGMPLGANLINGIVASILVIAVGLLMHFAPQAVDNIFWPFFALNVITLLASYLFLFPAFAKLRRTDAETERPFRVPGGKVLTALMTWVPFVILALAIFFCLFYYDAPGAGIFGSGLVLDKILLYGTIAAVIVGEVIAFVCTRRKKETE